jgi:predicted nuclease of predicted toxin-antitoxin system
MIFRFVCDHDVDVAVAMMLRKAGYEAWTAADAGLYRAGDDDLTVYADNKDAVLISHDTCSAPGRSLWSGIIAPLTSTGMLS